MTVAAIVSLLQSVAALILFVQSNPDMSPATKAAALQTAQTTIAQVTKEVAEITKRQALEAAANPLVPIATFEKAVWLSRNGDGTQKLSVQGSAALIVPLRVAIVSPRYTGPTDLASLQKISPGKLPGYRIVNELTTPVVQGIWSIDLSAPSGTATVFVFDFRTGALLSKNDIVVAN